MGAYLFQVELATILDDCGRQHPTHWQLGPIGCCTHELQLSPIPRLLPDQLCRPSPNLHASYHLVCPTPSALCYAFHHPVYPTPYMLDATLFLAVVAVAVECFYTPTTTARSISDTTSPKHATHLLTTLLHSSFPLQVSPQPNLSSVVDLSSNTNCARK
jgi:hypothetical protein